MVKVGFICEGATEKILIERSDVFDILEEYNLAFSKKVINADGKFNIQNHLNKFAAILQDDGVTHFVILTDLDDEQCITSKKQQIKIHPNYSVVVAVREIESWYFGDAEALTNYFGAPIIVAQPESLEEPFATLVEKSKAIKNNRGIGSKIILAKQMVKSNFSIRRAALHPGCASAGYFLKTLQRLNTLNS